jgi:NAD-dependent SIR2 family protein deacetylase
MDRSEVRRRYWARAYVGWQRFAKAAPNPGHRALAELESLGAVATLITQNVDGLHQKAGSRAPIELHGSLHRVRCLECGSRFERQAVQRRLAEANEHLQVGRGILAADGDAQVDDDWIEQFQPVGCADCGGPLKPDVIFFGENVPRPRVDACFAAVDAADLLLVAGSSLTVFSGFRFARRAAERSIPVAIVNLGPTRADALATLRVEGRLGLVLPVLADALRRQADRDIHSTST